MEERLRVSGWGRRGFRAPSVHLLQFDKRNVFVGRKCWVDRGLISSAASCDGVRAPRDNMTISNRGEAHGDTFRDRLDTLRR